ncbi:hypothetical protein TNCV_685541 [Trichonephila clavipes]|nr:hypothetical protein TNCV_685541 [Trichonephila clavipes]
MRSISPPKKGDFSTGKRIQKGYQIWRENTWRDKCPIRQINRQQEFKSTEKNRRYEAPGKFEYNRKDMKFPASTNYNKDYEAPVSKYESVQRYQDSAQKGYYNKNYEKHSNHNASKHAQTNYSKNSKGNLHSHR